MPKRTCSIDGCEKPHEARGWCLEHYRRWQRHGDPLKVVRPHRADVCSIDGCDGAHFGKGWCAKHYQRWAAHGDPEHPPYSHHPPVAERLWAKVDKRGPIVDGHPELGPCWLWTGSKTWTGYGRIVVAGKRSPSHQVAYELEVGEIPEGTQLDHLCHTMSDCTAGDDCLHRSCVNPTHLEPVTFHENMRRSNAGLYLRMRTHCPQGHPYDEINTYVPPRGGRQCRICKNEQAALYRVRKRAAST